MDFPSPYCIHSPGKHLRNINIDPSELRENLTWNPIEGYIIRYPYISTNVFRNYVELNESVGPQRKDNIFTWWNSLGLEWISLSLIASFPHKTPTQYQHRPIRPYPALHERLCSNTIFWKNICFTDKWIFWHDSQASLAASNGWVIKMRHARNDWRRRMANHKWHGPYKPPRRRSFETVFVFKMQQ